MICLSVKCEPSHMKTVRNLIGPKVRMLRNQQGLSQAKLAAKCQMAGWDVSRDMIAAIEGQVRRVTEIELVGLAKILNVCGDSLLPDQKRAMKLLCSR
jgi:transcriptional regulator with XRE-family HTH domain